MSQLYDPTRIDLKLDPFEMRMTGTARHGMVPFDVPYISEIADNLFQGGCANDLLLPENIKHVVSLYKWEAYSCEHELDSVTVVTMYDSTSTPINRDQVVALANWVNVCRKTGPTLVHCQAGLNRSSLVAALALILGDGLTPEEAIATLKERRSPACLCNHVFTEWLLEEKYK